MTTDRQDDANQEAPATFRLERADITLGNLLKLHLALSGGEAKQLIQAGYVRVDGSVCEARGKRLRGGELIEIESAQAVRVVAPESTGGG